jgi:hypothetical protein
MAVAGVVESVHELRAAQRHSPQRRVPPGGYNHHLKGLSELSEVEYGLVTVGEADDHANFPANGLKVGVERRQEQVMGLFHAADGRLGDAHPASKLHLR